MVDYFHAAVCDLEDRLLAVIAKERRDTLANVTACVAAICTITRLGFGTSGQKILECVVSETNGDSETPAFATDWSCSYNLDSKN